MRYPLIILSAILAASPSTHAVELKTLLTPSNVNFWVGPNGIFEGGGDDVVFDAALAADPANQQPGPLNPTGSTLSLSVTDPTTAGLSIDGLFVAFSQATVEVGGNQLTYGNNAVTGFSGVNLTFNLFDPYVNGSDINSPAPGSTVPLLLNSAQPDSELAAIGTPTITFNTNNTFSSEFYTQDVGGGSPVVFKGNSGGTFLERGKDPFAVFAPDIAAFYANLILLMDVQHPNWTLVGSEFGQFETLDAANPQNSFNQFTNSSRVFYSEDPGASPIPLPAAAWLLLSALAALPRLSKRS